MDGKRLFAWLVVLAVSAPASALADTCAEDNETCVDSCGTDHGLKRDRTPLQRCLAQCDERLEDCKDQRSEERNTYGRARDDLPPAPRQDTQAWQETPAEPESERADSWRAGDESAPPAPRPAKQPEQSDTAFEEPAVRPPEEQAESAANRKPEPVAEERQVSEYPNPTPEPPPEPQPAPELRRQESSDDSSDSWGEP